MSSLYTVAEIRDIEKAAAAKLASGGLMLRAGHAAANLALQLLAGLADPHVLILAGPGNNGGDALEAAANLGQAGVDVSIAHFPGSGSTSVETGNALSRARVSDAQWLDGMPDAHGWDLIIDGLFGIGLARPLEGSFRELVGNVNHADCPVLALDVPSGLNADTGTVVGYPNGVAVRATHTVTFIGDKPGLHTGEGRDHAGVVTVAPLDLDETTFQAASAQLNEVALFARHLKARRQNSHKGSFGNIVVLGGALGMSGAPILAARSALYSGAGRVYVTPIAPGQHVDEAHPELMFRDWNDFDYALATVIAGPGMGLSEVATRLMKQVLDCDSAMVLDADALNLIARDAPLRLALQERASATVLTPHPLEAARLLGVNTTVIQHDRVAAARTLASSLNATVILKGSGSVIASPNGTVVINPTGNPGLATAGTGDILAGLCGSLLAQGWPEWESALAATWMHGMAADALVGDGIGPIGLTAGELPAEVRAVFNELVAAQNRRDGRRLL